MYYYNKVISLGLASILTPLPDFILLGYIAECRLGGSNGQAQLLLSLLLLSLLLLLILFY